MTRRPFFVGLVAVLAIVTTALGVQAAFDAEKQSEPPHAARSTASVQTGPLPLSVAGGEHAGDVIGWLDGIARAEYLEGIARAERADEEARLAAARAAAQRAGAGGGNSSTRCGDDLDCFLACTRSHESDTAGGYVAVSPDGTYRGAYQFEPRTWAAAVTRAGYPEYAGVPADQAPPEVQDVAAAQLYSERGNQPWGGRC